MEKSLDQFRVGNSYETEKFIGNGTTGVVYKGRNIDLDTPVAIKILNPELSKNEKFMQFLNYEIKSAFKLNHPNIVNLKETGKENDKFYIIMEYVEGKNLEEFLKEKKNISIAESIILLQQLALAIDYANSNDVIHKAIKPQNILVSQDNRIKLTGFGLSKALTSAWLTITGTSAAHVEYMSPEQAEGENIDYRCDIYSFGIIAYRLLTGEVPFKKEGNSILNLAMKHINIIPEPPKKINSDIPAWLDLLVLKCLEKKPEKRFQSGKALYDALTAKSLDALSVDQVKNHAGKESGNKTPIPQIVTAEDLENTFLDFESEEIKGKIMKSYLDKEEAPLQKEKETFTPDSNENIVAQSNNNKLAESPSLKNQKQLKLLLLIVILLELVIISIFVLILFSG